MVTSAIFQDFRANYRDLESWSIAQRRRVLEARHRECRELLYKELRAEKARSVDVHVVEHSHEILAVDAAEQYVHVESPPSVAGHSEWRLDGRVIPVTVLSPEICRIDTP